MSQIINKENFIDANYDVFKKFHQQLAVVTCGTVDNFRSLTVGWGMMGNVWGHPGSAITIYINPSRFTFEYMEKEEYFVVSFLPIEYRKDVITLGTKSGREVDKIALTNLVPKALERGVGFEQSELTFVCRKISSQQFDINSVPKEVREGIYKSMEPHYMYIGYIEDAYGIVK